MTTDDQTYEVYSLRYSTRAASRSHEFFMFGMYGEPDAELGMDYSFWLLRNEHRTVLVDTGFNRERALKKNRFMDVDPLELLQRMDVRPADVDHIIISHMHYDHVGNLDLFPNATFSIAREEFDYWSGPYGDRELMRILVDPAEVAIIQDLHRQERVQFVDGEADLFPGVRATTVGGHTPGQMIIEVSASSGEVVLASDAMHYYEETEFDRPFILFTNMGDLYRGYDILREITARPGTTVVAGHDPRVRQMFREAVPDVVDLTAAIAGV
jgi:glyoxylase-like metal-dependent hydrolase (beta-lactamase superfamily II)